MIKKIKKIHVPASIVPAVKNSVWLLFDRFLRLALGLVTSTWIARYLGPSEYGVLAYVLTYLAFFQAVVTLGMDGIVVRDIARNLSQANLLIGSVFIARCVSSIILWLVAVIVIYFIHGFQGQYVVLTAITGAVLLFQSSDTFDLWFQSQSKSKYTVKAKFLSYLIASLLKIYFLFLHAHLIFFAITIVIESLLSALFLSYIFIKNFCFNIKFSVSMIRKLLRESWPFIISNISIIIYMRLDQIFINKYLGPSFVGLYAAVLPLANLWTFIPVIISTSIAPYIAKAKSEGENNYKRILSIIFRGYAILAWLICIPVSCLSCYLVPFLFGVEYEKSWEVLSILIFSNMFINMGLAQTLWILNEKKPQISLYKTTFGAVVCVALNVILIPRYGINGAAISAVLSQFSSAILANIVLAPEIFKLQMKSLFLVK